MSLYDNNLFYAVLCLGGFLLQLVWLRVLPLKSPIEFDIGYHSGRREDAVFCLCIALSVCTLFRLFPGNHRIPMEDSSVFLYIGQQMKEGKVPYLDLFDHKGPILYLIQYLGVLIAEKNFIGVWFLEVLNMVATAALMLKLGQSVNGKRSSIYLAVLVSVGACGWKIWQGGNFTEEFALPWITLSAVIFLSFFRSRQYKKVEIVLLGVSFAVVFLLRANMIAVWAAWMPIVLVLFVREKRFQDIAVCIVCFLCGVVLVLVPVLLVAAHGGFLKAMWQVYILFNFSYTENAMSAGEYLKLMLYFCKVLWPGVLALVLTLLLRPRNKFLWANALFFAVSLYTVTMSGRGYYHYAIVLLPTLILPMTALFEVSGEIITGKNSGAERCRPAVMSVSFVLILAAAFLYRGLSAGEPLQETAVQYILGHTEKDDDVLILGNSCWYYLESDRKTENRFFYQLPPAEISEEIYDQFILELAAQPSRLVLLPGVQGEREVTDIALKEIREVLFSMGYRNEIYDEFEVFMLTDDRKAET